jgi:hypothetical protein
MTRPQLQGEPQRSKRMTPQQRQQNWLLWTRGARAALKKE